MNARSQFEAIANSLQHVSTVLEQLLQDPTTPLLNNLTTVLLQAIQGPITLVNSAQQLLAEEQSVTQPAPSPATSPLQHASPEPSAPSAPTVTVQSKPHNTKKTKRDKDSVMEAARQILHDANDWLTAAQITERLDSSQGEHSRGSIGGLMARRREVFQRSEMYTPVRWRLVESLRPPPTNSRTSPTDGDEKPEGEKRKYKKRARKQTGMPVPLVASAAEEDKTPSPVDPSRFTLPPSEREPSPPSSDLPNYPPSSPATHSFTRTPLSSYNLHSLQLPSSHSGGGALMFRSERVDSSFNPPRQLTTLTPESSFPLPTRLSSSNIGGGVSMFRPEGLNLGLTDPTRLFHDSTFANLIQTVHLPHEESSLPPIDTSSRTYDNIEDLYHSARDSTVCATPATVVASDSSTWSDSTFNFDYPPPITTTSPPTPSTSSDVYPLPFAKVKAAFKPLRPKHPLPLPRRTLPPLPFTKIGGVGRYNEDVEMEEREQEVFEGRVDEEGEFEEF